MALKRVFVVQEAAGPMVAVLRRGRLRRHRPRGERRISSASVRRALQLAVERDRAAGVWHTTRGEHDTGTSHT